MTSDTASTRYWIAVVPKIGVDKAVAGKFAMFAHGQKAAMERVHPGDWLAYYSPRTEMRGGDEVRSFTAIGRFTNRDPYESEVALGQIVWRRGINWETGTRPADVYPLLDQLGFIRDRRNWGIFFHRSLFSVSRDDFRLIGAAMGLDPHRL